MYYSVIFLKLLSLGILRQGGETFAYNHWTLSQPPVFQLYLFTQCPPSLGIATGTCHLSLISVDRGQRDITKALYAHSSMLCLSSVLCLV
jgi:hypothetical protein